MSAKIPHEVDVIVGQNIRQMRMQRDISQGELAKALGITFQQIQKYEKGTNRISASRLHTAAVFFDVPAASFFAGTEKGGAASPILSASDEAIRLAQNFDQIRDKKVRQKIGSLIRTLASDADGEDTELSE